MEEINQQIATLVHSELSEYKINQINIVLTLLAEGNTVPFIARYRKERTGSLDEVAIRNIDERYQYLQNLSKRKAEVLKNIEAQEKLTEKLQRQIQQATTLQRVEDLYRPYKQKRRTKATIAKEAGLQPLADWILTLPNQTSLESKAIQFIDDDKAVFSVEDALQGAHEIIAEYISDQAEFRKKIREYTYSRGEIISECKREVEDPQAVYEMYYDYSEKVNQSLPHRILAINRGEKAEVLKVAIKVEQQPLLDYLQLKIIKDTNNQEISEFLEKVIADSYKRFIAPAIEREIRSKLTEKAEQQAIHIFGENLYHLLLQSPLKGKVVLGFDPAYRTGCKLAVVDPTGKLLKVTVIYPHKPAKKALREQASIELQKLISEYNIEMIAIGNGTASRESEQFVSEIIKNSQKEVYYTIVSEAGASVYSASDLAREEFPTLHVEERSAVSIARRLQDPLAELVKIDPKAVGVGQYQHDVSEKELTKQLEFIVETAVNQVGVNINTASAPLLEHISGLNKTTAKNIVAYREEHGEYNARTDVKKVSRLGPKAYEQSIGFLRIPDGDNLFDQTEIHPESYKLTEKILNLLAISKDVIKTSESKEKLASADAAFISQQLEVGKETVIDIINALQKPGRDLREEASQPLLRKDVLTMEDLKPGMELEGIIRNVVDFGAFVDIGVKQDGLVHISKLSTKYVKHPTDMVAVGEIVKVWVEQVDVSKQRISLTMLPINKDNINN